MGDGGGGDDLHSGDNGVGGNNHVDMKPSAEYLMGLGYGGGGVVGRKDGGGSSALTAAYPPPAESPANSGKAHFFIFCSLPTPPSPGFTLILLQ
jgi:hypothetical protein